MKMMPVIIWIVVTGLILSSCSNPVKPPALKHPDCTPLEKVTPEEKAYVSNIATPGEPGTCMPAVDVCAIKRSHLEKIVINMKRRDACLDKYRGTIDATRNP